MAQLPIPSPHSPLLGRGLAFRFDGLADLVPFPEEIPTPPEPVPLDSIPAATSAEGELPFLTIAEASSLIRSGELSPIELTRALLARIERLNRALNAYITVTGDLALSQAKEAETQIKSGDYRGPLHGVPVSLKDLIATAGVLTTGGTGALSDWVPRQDATVWQRLRQTGAVLLGKVNLHEMAAGGTGLNQFYGPARNPWATDRVTGGSSSGSAAAIAAHLCLASVGSDTGGSIRGPAGLCGIVGLKPTFGLVSTRGALYLAWTNDHLGPITKTVEDAAIVLAIAGYDPSYPLSAPVSIEDYTSQLNGDLKGLRLAVPTNYFWELQMAEDGGPVRMGADPDVVKTVRAAIQVLKDLGAEVSEIEIEGLDDVLGGPSLTASPVERAFFLRSYHRSERTALAADTSTAMFGRPTQRPWITYARSKAATAFRSS